MEQAGPALDAARKFALDVNAEKQAALKLAEPLADAMIEAQLLEAHDKPLFLQKLASHDGSIEIIGNLVTHIGQLKTAYAQKLAVAQGGGQPTDLNGHGKAASATQPVVGNNGRPHFVGAKAGLGEKRASDHPLRRLAGLPNDE